MSGFYANLTIRMILPSTTTACCSKAIPSASTTPLVSPKPINSWSWPRHRQTPCSAKTSASSGHVFQIWQRLRYLRRACLQLWSRHRKQKHRPEKTEIRQLQHLPPPIAVTKAKDIKAYTIVAWSKYGSCIFPKPNSRMKQLATSGVFVYSSNNLSSSSNFSILYCFTTLWYDLFSLRRFS